MANRTRVGGKMDTVLIVIIGIIIVLVVAFLIWYFGFSGATTTHSITYNSTLVYTSSATIPNTSDGSSTIYYAAPDGIYAYNINTKTTTLYSSFQAVGLAYYQGNLLAIDDNGNMYNLTVSPSTIIAVDVTALYSTTSGGYAFTMNGVTSYNGTTKTATNGSYGLITYTVT